MKLKNNGLNASALWIGLIVLIASQTLTMRSEADDSEFPPGKTVTIDGAEHKCFTAEEYRTIVYLYIDYKSVTEQAARAAELVASLQRERDEWKALAAVEKKRGDDFKVELKRQLTPWWVAVVTEAAAILVLGGAEIARAAK